MKTNFEGKTATLTERDLRDLIIKHSAHVTSEIFDDADINTILALGFFTAKLVKDILDDVFGDDK